MSDDKTTPELELLDTSVSSPDEEPKQTSAKSVGAKPAKRKIAHNAVVGGGDTDPIVYSKARVPGPTEGRKSLTVLHIQRRLADEGFPDAASAPGGRFEALTTRAVSLWQESRKEPATGVLTREQFEALFEGDPNVTLTIDTHEDHKV
jgi:peptidoglycan hydrolase-like protein with peptidoglycan-binding domain